MEYRNRTTGPPANFPPTIFYAGRAGTPVEAGFTIEVEVVKGTQPYWADYGDGYFGQGWNHSKQEISTS